MSASRAFREALADADVGRCMALWAAVRPHMPQPGSRLEAEVMMHGARTAAESIPLPKRLYSHGWLEERGYKSELPDDLRPEPRRPVIVSAVGISVNFSRGRREEAKYIERVMADAAADAMLSGITDPALVSRIMWQARREAMRGI